MLRDTVPPDVRITRPSGVITVPSGRMIVPSLRTMLPSDVRRPSVLDLICAESGALELSLRLGGALWRFWSTRGYLGEGLRWLDAALAQAAPPTPVLTRALNGAANLAREGIDLERVCFVGNVMIDSLLQHRQQAVAPIETLAHEGVPANFLDGSDGFGVVTLHRPSNVDEPVALRESLSGGQAFVLSLSEFATRSEA